MHHSLTVSSLFAKFPDVTALSNASVLMVHLPIQIEELTPASSSDRHSCCMKHNYFDNFPVVWILLDFQIGSFNGRKIICKSMKTDKLMYYDQFLSEFTKLRVFWLHLLL